MIDFINSLIHYQFVQHAIIASILASIVCGIVGVIIYEKKLIMMSGGIAHTAYGGIGLGYLLGFEPILGAFFISICAALIIGFIKRKGSTNTDVLIGLFWSFGMALGIFFVALMPGYPPDMSSYLFGSILSVTRNDLYLMTALTVLVIILITSLFNYWKSYMFDDEFATVTGIKTVILEYLLFILIAMSVVVLIRVAGIILVLALLTAPTAISGLLTKRLEFRMLLSIAIGCFFCFNGLLVSYTINIPSGATIVIFAAACFAIVYAVLHLKRSLALSKTRNSLINF